MKLYFPQKHDWSKSYLNEKEISHETPEKTQSTVEKWLMENGYKLDAFYTHIVKNTLSHIKPNSEFGVFLYNHVNAYLREVAYLVWNQTDQRVALEQSMAAPVKKAVEEREKKANAGMKDYLDFAELNFSKKATKNKK